MTTVPPIGSERPSEHDAESLVDPRIRRLLQEYCDLAGAELGEVAPHLAELRLPTSDRSYFGQPATQGPGYRPILIAFSLDTLEENPDAEMAVVGSDLFDRLVSAIQARGFRINYGVIPPSLSPTALSQIPVEVLQASASLVKSSLSRTSVGRVVTRVVVRAGSTIEEQIVESRWFDLASGSPLGEDLATLCAELQVQPNNGEEFPTYSEIITQQLDVGMFLPNLLKDVETSLADVISRVGKEAASSLKAELDRVDRYYNTLLTEEGVGARAATQGQNQVVKAEWERRRAEEDRRHEVRYVVHPLQLEECHLLMQTVDWVLTSSEHVTGTVAATRPLSGAGVWTMPCPTCRTPASKIIVCHHGHVACGNCSVMCSVCDHPNCRDHGSQCHVDGRWACDRHADQCAVCLRPYCHGHRILCVDGEHPVCSSCATACARCGRVVCDDHVRQSAAGAPKGPRRLCLDCTVYCEGGSNEPVGRDEAVECSTCDNFVCERHQAACDVDGLIHCSKHLRRTDHTRRLACEKHRSSCDQEPAAILASDEVGDCARCGRQVCDRHSDYCAVDRMRHCSEHLVPMLDTDGEMACPDHHAVCHVDGGTYSVVGTVECPVCAKTMCKKHAVECHSCGRVFCIRDQSSKGGTCLTCTRLSEIADPDDVVIDASILANRGDPVSAKRWRQAQDSGHIVAEADLGWRRRLVFTIRHGDVHPDTVISHGLFGLRSKRALLSSSVS